MHFPFPRVPPLLNPAGVHIPIHVSIEWRTPFCGIVIPVPHPSTSLRALPSPIHWHYWWVRLLLIFLRYQRGLEIVLYIPGSTLIDCYFYVTRNLTVWFTVSWVDQFKCSIFNIFCLIQGKSDAFKIMSKNISYYFNIY